MKDTSTVLIKSIAYYKMLIHVLRFGSKMIDSNHYKEVMGMLIGHIEGEGTIKNVIIEDAIPVSHGGSIEVRFSNEQLGAFGEIDMKIWDKYGSKKWFTVGWYHSHPGLKCFFSSTDIYNQLFWQDKNPSAIGIVFDHKNLEEPENMGFKTFRLDDPSKNLNSGYHEVKTVVEPPDSLEYYFKIMELIACIHTREPPILEVNENPDFFRDLTFTSPKDVNYKTPVLKVSELLNAMQNGLSHFIDSAFTPLIRFLNVWSQEIVKRGVENNFLMSEQMNALKIEFGNKISKLQDNLKMSLISKLNQMESYIDDKLDGIDKNNEEIKDLLDQTNVKIIEQVNSLFKEKIMNYFQEVINNFKENSRILNKVNDNNFHTLNIIEKQSSSLHKLNDTLKMFQELIKATLDGKMNEIEGKLIEQVRNFSNQIKKLTNEAKDTSNEVETSFSKLKNSLKSLKSENDSMRLENKALNKKIETLTLDAQSLKVQIEKMVSEKQNLLNKLNEIEKIGD